MDYNFWDDRTYNLDINPCKGCSEYVNGICISECGCSSALEDNEIDSEVF